MASRSGPTSTALNILPTASPWRKSETAAWMRPPCLPAAHHITARANTGLRRQDGSGLQASGLLCTHPAQRGARGCCLDLQASGERGPLREIQPSQMQRLGYPKLDQGVPGTLPWRSIQTHLCACLGCVCWRASSQSAALLKEMTSLAV